LKGSKAKPPLVTMPKNNSKAFVIVESELDLMLIHQEIGDRVNGAAMGNATNRPDPALHTHLLKADRILVSLDNDKPGEKGSAWWLENYERAVRYKPIKKDPGNMFKAGLSIRKWVMAGIINPKNGGVA